MDGNRVFLLEITVGIVQGIIDRWDKPKYTDESQPMRGLISELRQVFKDLENHPD